MNNKIVRTSVLILSITIGILITVPFFLGTEALKYNLEQKIGTELKTKVEIKEGVNIAFLPFPKVVAHNFNIENLEFNNSKNTIHSKVVEIFPSFFSIFSGNVKIGKIVFRSPKIESKNLPATPKDDAVQNTENTDKTAPPPTIATHKKDDGIAGAIFNIKNTKTENLRLTNIEKIEVENGHILQLDINGESKLEFKNINLEANNNIRTHSFKITGSFLSEEIPTVFKLIINTKKNSDSKLSIDSPILKVNIEGKFSEVDFNNLLKSDFSGKISAEIIDLKIVLNKYISRNSLIFRKINSTKPIRINADFKGIKGEVGIDNLDIDSQIIKGSGRFDANFAEKVPIIDINILLNNIDIDSIWMSEIVTSNENITKSQSNIVESFIGSQSQFYHEADLEKSRLINDEKPAPKLASFFKNIDLTAEIEMKSARYLGGDLKDLSLYFIISKQGEFLLQPMLVGIPGNGILRVSGAFSHENDIPKFIGKIDAVGKNLEQFLSWLKVEPQNLKHGSLTDYAFTSDLLILPNFTILNNLYGSLNNNKNLFGGDLKIDDTTNSSNVVGNFRINDFDIEDYFLIDGKNQYLSRGSLLKKLLWLNTLNSSNDISLFFSKLKYKENIFTDQILKFKIGQGFFNLKDFALQSPDFDLKGNVSINISSQIPVLDINLKSENFKYITKPIENKESTDKSKSPLPTFKSGLVEQFFNLPSLDDFSGNIAIDIKNMQSDNFLMKDIKISGKMKSGIIEFSNFELGLYEDSSFKYNGSMAVKNSKAASGSFELTNVKNELLLNDIFDSKRISGTSNFSGVVSFTAEDRETFFKSLDTQIKFVSANVFMEGFGIDDLVKKMFQPIQNQVELRKPLDILYNPESRSFFKDVKGSLDIRRNNRENKLRIETSSVGVNSVVTGSVNFENATIETLSNIIFLTGTRNKQIPITIAINAKGKIDNLGVSTNIDQANQYLKMMQ